MIPGSRKIVTLSARHPQYRSFHFAPGMNRKGSKTIAAMLSFADIPRPHSAALATT